MGDFNGHNLLCGKQPPTMANNFLSQEGLCILNNDNDTYLHFRNGSYSAIDLTVTDSSLILDFSLKVHNDLCGSYHFPIILESLNSTVSERTTLYQFDKADRLLYGKMSREELQTQLMRNITDPILKFIETVISIADKTIPKT